MDAFKQTLPNSHEFCILLFTNIFITEQIAYIAVILMYIKSILIYVFKLFKVHENKVYAEMGSFMLLCEKRLANLNSEQLIRADL